MDPYAVLGVDAAADAEQIARAYRELAKRFHPDRAGADGEARMRSVNAAYDELRAGRRPAPAPGAPAPARPRRRGPAGAWLDARTRRSLGGELLAELEHGEAVLLTADAATWDSPEVRLAVTDRRLLWLRDMAISDRVRWEPYTAIARVEARMGRRLRRTGELQVTTRAGRRHRFGELRPDVLEAIVQAVQPRVAA